MGDCYGWGWCGRGGGGGKMGGELEVRWTGHSTAVGSWSLYYVQGGMGM